MSQDPSLCIEAACLSCSGPSLCASLPCGPSPVTLPASAHGQVDQAPPPNTAPNTAAFYGALDLISNDIFHLMLQVQALEARQEFAIKAAQAALQRTRQELQQLSQEDAQQHAAPRQATQVGLLLRCPKLELYVNVLGYMLHLLCSMHACCCLAANHPSALHVSDWQVWLTDCVVDTGAAQC